MRYLVIFEKGKKNYSAYCPDLPGCVSAGATIKECEKSIREAVQLHLEGLKAEGFSVPPPTSQADYVTV